MAPQLIAVALGASLLAAVPARVEPAQAFPAPVMGATDVLTRVAPPLPSLADEISAALAELERPADAWLPSEIAFMSRDTIANVGSIALGPATRGVLLNGVQLGPGVGYELVEPERSWGTTETVLALRAVLWRLYRDDPQAPLLYVGQISRQGGGWLKRHRSHQNGRDVDLGLFYRDGAHWYQRATQENLDVARTWKLVSLLMQTDRIEYIFADRLIVQLLSDHATALGISEAERTRTFYDRKLAPDGALRHAWGHREHLHVRFRSPLAEQRGQALLPQLRKLQLVGPGRY